MEGSQTLGTGALKVISTGVSGVKWELKCGQKCLGIEYYYGTKMKHWLKIFFYNFSVFIQWVNNK